MLKGKYVTKKKKKLIEFFSSEDEISLDKGIWVSILQKKSDGWWLVQYEKQRGWFPSNYLVEVKREKS